MFMVTVPRLHPVCARPPWLRVQPSAFHEQNFTEDICTTLQTTFLFIRKVTAFVDLSLHFQT